jgi:hypothetical protein
MKLSRTQCSDVRVVGPGVFIANMLIPRIADNTLSALAAVPGSMVAHLDPCSRSHKLETMEYVLILLMYLSVPTIMATWNSILKN